MQVHPYLQCRKLVEFAMAEGIQVMGWAMGMNM